MKRAFTLIELLLVIAILAILAGILLPVISRTKEAARSAACLSNLHQIGIALQIYVSDNQNRLPVAFDRADRLKLFLEFIAERPGRGPSPSFWHGL
jgi:prepilin-type N-terminal cleavage/methylation domain-containing protein